VCEQCLHLDIACPECSSLQRPVEGLHSTEFEKVRKEKKKVKVKKVVKRKEELEIN